VHECPTCGEMCDCDGEDHGQPAPEDCDHQCDFLDGDETDFANDLEVEVDDDSVDLLDDERILL